MNKNVIYSLSFIVAALLAVWFTGPKNVVAEDDLIYDASCYCYYRPTPKASPEPTPIFPIEFPDESPTPEVTPTPIVTPSPELPVMPTPSPTVEPTPTPNPTPESVITETKGEATPTPTPTASPTPVADGRGGVSSPSPSVTPVVAAEKPEADKPTPSSAPTVITLIEPVLTRLPQAGVNFVTLAHGISGALAFTYMVVRNRLKDRN